MKVLTFVSFEFQVKRIKDWAESIQINNDWKFSDSVKDISTDFKSKMTIQDKPKEINIVYILQSKLKQKNKGKTQQ